MFLPLSLHLNTRGRQSTGEAREGQGWAACVACALLLAALALAQQLLEAQLKVTPQ